MINWYHTCLTLIWTQTLTLTLTLTLGLGLGFGMYSYDISLSYNLWCTYLFHTLYRWPSFCVLHSAKYPCPVVSAHNLKQCRCTEISFVAITNFQLKSSKFKHIAEKPTVFMCKYHTYSSTLWANLLLWSLAGSMVTWKKEVWIATKLDLIYIHIHNGGIGRTIILRGCAGYQMIDNQWGA